MPYLLDCVDFSTLSCERNWSCTVSHCIKRRKDAFCSALCRPVWQGVDPFWKAFGELEMLQITGSHAFVNKLPPQICPQAVFCAHFHKRKPEIVVKHLWIFGFKYAIGWRQGLVRGEHTWKLHSYLTDTHIPVSKVIEHFTKVGKHFPFLCFTIVARRDAK